MIQHGPDHDMLYLVLSFSMVRPKTMITRNARELELFHHQILWLDVEETASSRLPTPAL